MLDFEAGSGDLDNFWAVADAITAAGAHVALSYIPHWYWQQIGSPSLTGVPGLVASDYVEGSGYASALYPGDDSGFWTGYGGIDPVILQFTDTAQVAGQPHRGDRRDAQDPRHLRHQEPRDEQVNRAPRRTGASGCVSQAAEFSSRR